MSGLEVGVSTHVLRGFCLEKHPGLFARHGMDLMELSSREFAYFTSDADFRELRKALQDARIRVNSIHVPFYGPPPATGPLDISHPDAAVRARAIEVATICAERLAELDGRCIVIHPSTEPVTEDRRTRLGLARGSLLELKSRIPCDAGVRIAVENLPRSNLGRVSSEIVGLVRELDDPMFGICLDVNHANLEEDLLDATRACAPYVITTHVCDNDGQGERHWLPGRGVIAWKEWIATMVRCGYTGPFVYETGSLGDCDEQTLAEIARNIKELFRDAGAPPNE